MGLRPPNNTCAVRRRQSEGLRMTLLADHRVLQLLRELKAAYQGFTWESALWADTGGRRSPYRALALFGLSARTRDALLVDVCRRFFRLFPDAPTLAALGQDRDGWQDLAEEARSIVRAGQWPYVVSMAEAVAQGVPRERDALLRIKGVGDKITECVLAYGWGEDALPLDANGVRVLGRVFGLPGGERRPAPLREGLKCVYGRRCQQFADLSIAMVDIHEILRLHGQVCCAKTPECSRCPVTGCRSRREPQIELVVIQTPPGLWDDWRELIYEPAGI